MNVEDYIKIFEQSSELLVVIDTNFIIVAASDNYLKSTLTVRENIVGCDIFKVFPDNPGDPTANGESIVRASFKMVLETKVPDFLPVVKYDIPKPELEGGGFKEKYWQATHSPLLDEENNVKYIIQRAKDVTENTELITQLELEQKALKQIEDSEKRYNLMLMKSPFAFAVLKGKNMVITLANDSVKEMWGKGKDLEGKPLLEVLPELKNSEFPGLLDNVYTTGTPFTGEELLAPVFRNGKLEDVYFNFVYQPYLEADETISGVTVIAYEVTASVIVKKALEVQHEVEQKALKQIEDSEHRYKEMIYSSPSLISICKGENMIIEIANEAMLQSWGKGNIIGKSVFEAIPESIEQGFDKLLLSVYKTGQPVQAFEAPVTLLRNGIKELIYYNFIYQAQRNTNGEIVGVASIANEVTPQAILNLKIKESEERFRLLVMQAPVSICVLRGDDFIIETMNQEMANFLDRKIEDSLHKPLFDVITEVKDQVYKELLDTVYKTGTRFVSQELPLAINRNGRLEDVFVKFVYEPLHEVDGTISGVMILADEITDQVNARKAVEVSEKKFRLLTNNMPQKIINADAEGNVIFFNQQWLDDTGLTFNELVDYGWVKAMHPDDLELTLNNWKHSVAKGDVFEMECRIQNKEGDYKWHLSRAAPIKDEAGKIIMWVGSNTDIHELKEAKSKAESAMKAKQQFLSNMSHEIRTPMNAVIGFTNILLKTTLTEQQKEYINAIKVSGDSLIVLINDILDLAKVDAGKMTFEQTPFALSESIVETLHLFEPKILEKNLVLIEKYDASIPEIILGDAVRLRQIILNLLSNAVKFTKEGTITLSVQILQEVASSITIEFSVTDTGIGIAENKLEYIFGDFQQATDETARLHGGTGLGLSIVKQYVELQGGTFFVNSKQGKGSTFGFVLTFKKSIAETADKAEIKGIDEELELTQRNKKTRVLVAEDMPLNQLLIKIILQDFGFEVDIVGNGKIAINNLLENEYDIILMDLQMPELNGFEATEHIRRNINVQIPIIALTADVTTVDVEKCIVAGMNDYISKPIDEKLLFSKIMKYI